MWTTSFATSSTTNGSTWPWRSASCFRPRSKRCAQRTGQILLWNLPIATTRSTSRVLKRSSTRSGETFWRWKRKRRQSGLTDPGSGARISRACRPAAALQQGLRAPPALHHRANSAQMLKVGAQVCRDATALEKFRRPERGAPVSYRYSFEDLLALLHGHAPAKVDAVALHRRRVEHGHLSVGLKIHCLGGGSQFSTLVEGLGGAQKILDVNYYKHCHASLCLVLPPVGSARSAILLLECIEHFIGSALFSNPEIQI